MTDYASLKQREDWAERRSRMEAGDVKRTPDRRRRRRRWPLFKLLLAGFGHALRGAGLYRRGVRNALDLRLAAFDVALSGLPAAFDGYRILHLSDLHLDALDALPARLAALVAGLEADLCVLTGDYRFRVHGEIDGILPGLATLMRALRAPDGIYAVLGNHDTVEMVPHLERLGIRVLANQTVTIARPGAALHVTGIDDVHYYYTEEADEALRCAPDGFRIALVHSPEFAEQAAAHGFALYLTGHTHGGQVCLPGGVPVITHAVCRRRFATGRWRHGAMEGHTSRGVGVSGLPVRFNSRGEAALVTLRRAAADA